MPVTCAIYCPLDDGDLGPLARDFITRFDSCDQTIHWGGAANLGTVAVNTRLYLLAHAHYEQVKFEAGDEQYSAEEMAQMLVRDGLPAGIKNLELLTCRAGLSTVSKVLMETFRDLSTKYQRAKNQHDQATMARLEVEYKKLAAKLPDAKDYESDDQALPLGAQLAQALGTRERKALTITCYKAPISYLFLEGQVWLNLPGKVGPRKAKNHADLKTLWRCA